MLRFYYIDFPFDWLFIYILYLLYTWFSTTVKEDMDAYADPAFEVAYIEREIRPTPSTGWRIGLDFEVPSLG